MGTDAGEAVDAEFMAQGLDGFDRDVQAGEIKKMLGGEHDRTNAILSIHPGAGGTESQDWAEMLLRMYMRWTERRGFTRELVDYQPGEEAGLKSATVLVSGEYRLRFARGGGRRPSPRAHPRRSTRPRAAIPRSRPFTCGRNCPRTWRSRSTRRISGSTRIARAARAGST